MTRRGVELQETWHATTRYLQRGERGRRAHNAPSPHVPPYTSTICSPTPHLAILALLVREARLCDVHWHLEHRRLLYGVVQPCGMGGKGKPKVGHGAKSNVGPSMQLLWGDVCGGHSGHRWSQWSQWSQVVTVVTGGHGGHRCLQFASSDCTHAPRSCMPMADASLCHGR
eukprot:365076-Chlamydomonas_euryale.AAC.11